MKIYAATPYLRFVQIGTWDFIQRNNVSGVVSVIALTDDRNLLFVEQYRPPVAANVIEFPAGLAGDQPDQRDEDLRTAAERELLEETGFKAGQLFQVMKGPSSAGLTDEQITFFIATQLEKLGQGGGDESEEILVHEVPLETVDQWLDQKRQEGALLDARLYSGLYLLNRFLTRQGE